MNLTIHDLGGGCTFQVGRLPLHLIWDQALFDRIWNLHPLEKHKIMMHGHWVEIPRWQEAYGKDYHFSGTYKEAKPIPEVLLPQTEWIQASIYPGLNGLLLNWYDGPEHYIGPHHDSTKHMTQDAPIVTVSFGETRIFRLTLEGKRERKKVVEEIRDFPAEHGTVFVMPFLTNKVWKHGVPKSTWYSKRRISVTYRSLE